MQPGVKKLKGIGLWLVQPRYFEKRGNCPTILLEAEYAIRMDPENPCVW